MTGRKGKAFAHEDTFIQKIWRQMLCPYMAITIFLFLAACTAPGPTASPSATPDLQATIDAALAGTQAAEANLQATVDAAIAATAQAAVTPTGADLSEQSEEATVDEIETTVDSCASNTAAASTASEATSDDALTAEEADQIYTYYQLAYADLEEAYALLSGYYAFYGELAQESLDLLHDLEEDLDDLNAALGELNTAILIIQTQLIAGATPSAGDIARLETAADSANTAADNARTMAGTWATAHEIEIAERAAEVNYTIAEAIPANRVDTITSVYTFLDDLKAALLDRVISADELALLLVDRANALAGIDAHGGATLQKAVDPLNQITVMIATGNFPAARAAIPDFEAILPDRP